MRSVIVVFLTSSSTESWKPYFLVSLLSRFGACINMCDWLILGGTDIHHLHSSNGMLMGLEHCGRTVVCRCILLEDASREWTPQDWGVLCKIGCRRNHSSCWVKRTMYSFHWWSFSSGTHSRHNEKGSSIFGLFFTQKCSRYDGFNIPD